MSDRPILFTSEMVRAILDGRKTQTRRVVSAKHLALFDLGPVAMMSGWKDRPLPYGKTGDRLWVRETFCDATDFGWGRVLYRASGDACCRWKPSIFMPRSLSRITLEVTGVRVERLQDISSADCIAEGCPGDHGSIPDYNYHATPAEHFRHVWKSINGPESWAINPLVWVIEFRVLQP
jgi:hypothetical protein